MRRLAVSLVGVLLIAGLGGGCADQRRTVVSSRTVQSRPAPPQPASTSTVVEQQTTTTTRGESRGVLSTIVHVVGEVLALPFRIIGGVLRVIF